MGKRIGLARMEALLENLKREIDWGAGARFVGMKKKVTNITVAKTLVEAESGTVFTIDADSGAYDITLPANATTGWYCTFILTDAHGSQDIDIVAATADTMQGIHVDASPTAITLADKITFVGGTAVVGDRVEVVSDGTTWQCVTYSGANGGITSSG
jgi:hypothetical protein